MSKVGIDCDGPGRTGLSAARNCRLTSPCRFRRASARRPVWRIFQRSTLYPGIFSLRWIVPKHYPPWRTL